MIDVAYEALNRTASWAVIPLAPITNTSGFASQPHCAALRYVIFLTPENALSKQADTFSFLADASIQLLKVNPVLHGAILNQVSIGNVWIIGYHAIGKPEPHLHVGVDMRCTQEDDVSETFSGAVFAGNSVRVGIDAGTV